MFRVASVGTIVPKLGLFEIFGTIGTSQMKKARFWDYLPSGEETQEDSVDPAVPCLLPAVLCVSGKLRSLKLTFLTTLRPTANNPSAKFIIMIHDPSSV
jgi:hypothetical protein